MFNDVPESRWSHGLIKRAVQAGLLEGFPDDTFRPGEPVTREQAAAIAVRIVENIPGNQLIEENLPSNVVIHHYVGDDGGLGSGVWIEPWKVLTNAHVVATRDGEKGQHVVYGYEGAGFDPTGAMDAEVEAINHEYDLALLNVDKPPYGSLIDLRTVELGPTPIRGDKVWAIGAPFGMPWDAVDGVLRHPQRRVNYWHEPQVMFGLSAGINPGNSGGGLFNVYGEFVGVPSAGWVGANVFTFAVPVHQVKLFMRNAGYEY